MASYVEEREKVIEHVAIKLATRWWQTRGQVPDYLNSAAEVKRMAPMFRVDATLAVDAVREIDAQLEREKLDPPDASS
jgi:hypothetical protein